jgi:hypothetical protein
MDLSLDAFRDPKAAPDQWMGIEAARAVLFVANRDPVGVSLLAMASCLTVIYRRTNRIASKLTLTRQNAN